MLATSKVSSLADKCVFYRPENNAREGNPRNWILKMQKMKYTNEESSKSRWENGVICLVNMFAPGVMVIKMSKMTLYGLYFLLMPAKNQSLIWRKYLRASERSYLALSEN